MKLSVAEESEKEPIKKEIDFHHVDADDAYLKKYADKSLAKQATDTKCYTFDLQQCLPTPFLPISQEKKSSLIDLLPLISEPFRQFYRGLRTSATAEDVYPDIVEFDEDQQ
nr:unnamed protein product [Callosobruchus chinensis]